MAELVRHPEELSPNVRREDVKKKEQEEKAPPGGQTAIQMGSDDADSGENKDKAQNQGKDAAASTDEDDAKPREEIRVHYYQGGYCFNAWTDAYDYPIKAAAGVSYIPPAVWRNWASDDTTRFFPDGEAWHIRVNIRNTTGNTYAAPVLHMSYNDGAETTVRDYVAGPLEPGGSVDIDIPLAGLRIVNPGEEGYHARPMQLDVQGIDHELFNGHMNIDFIPKAQPHFGR